jgi:SPX domain protein involved in polyphosphate accumulation
MKFGEYLLSQRIVGWEQYYLDYIALKNLIKALQDAEDNHEAGKLGKGSFFHHKNSTHFFLFSSLFLLYFFQQLL